MTIRYTWTSSMKKAWGFVTSGVERGMTMTAALREYRAGGGKIRTSFWGDLYREGFSLFGSAERVIGIPMSYKIPETLFTDSPFDWRRAYIVQARIVTRDEVTNVPTRRWVTVESDELLTKKEWINGIQDAINYTPDTLPGMFERVMEWMCYKRRR